MYVIFCFSLVTFNIFFFDLIFISFINMSQHVALWVYFVWDSVVPGLEFFLSHARITFGYNLSFLSLFSF